jgi:hypothetical protein
MDENYDNLKISPDGSSVEGDYFQGKKAYHFVVTRRERKMPRKERRERSCPHHSHCVKGHWQKKPEGFGRMWVKGHCAEDP